jgi:hypothetical protein
VAAASPKPGVRRGSRFNRLVVWWLSSPLGFLSGRARLVRYSGRTSGRRYSLPVNPMPYDCGYLIRVGHAETKTWWRNFTAPWPIEVVHGRRVVRGTAVVVQGSTGRGQQIAAEWFLVHHGMAKRAGLPRIWKGEPATPEQLQSAAAELTFILVTPDR